MKKYRSLFLLYTASILFMIFYWFMAQCHTDIFLHYMVGEFGAPETLTALGFLGASLFAGCVLLHHKSMRIWSLFFFIGLVLFFFVCAGEEMSWGQHLLGFKTPESIAKINEQGEFNLHNLELENIHPKDIVSLFMKIYGILLPVVFIKKLKTPDSPWRKYLPQTALVPAFLLPELINSLQKPFDETLRGIIRLRYLADPTLSATLSSQAEEMTEMYWAMALLFAMASIYTVWKTSDDQPDAG